MVTITYILIFPSVIKLRHSRPEVPRPYRIPGGTAGLWVCGILTTAWAAFTTLEIIYPGTFTAHPDNSLPSGFTGERLQYTLSQVIPLVRDDSHRPAVLRARGAPTRRQTAAAVAPPRRPGDGGGGRSGRDRAGRSLVSEAGSSEAPSSENRSA